MPRAAAALKRAVDRIYPNGRKRSNGRASLDQYKGALERISTGDVDFAYSVLDDQALFSTFGSETKEALRKLSSVRRELDGLRERERLARGSVEDIQSQLTTYENELDEYTVIHDSISSVQGAATERVRQVIPKKGKRSSRLGAVAGATEGQSIHDAREMAEAELDMFSQLDQEITASSYDFRLAKRRRDYEMAAAEYSATFARYKEAAERFQKIRGRLADRAKHSVNEFGFAEDTVKEQYLSLDRLEAETKKQLAETRKKIGSVAGRMKIVQRSRMLKEAKELRVEELEGQRAALQSSYEDLENRLKGIERNRQELRSRGIEGFLYAMELRRKGSLAIVDEFGFIVHDEKEGLFDRVKDILGKTSRKKRVKEYAEAADTLRTLERELEDRMISYLRSAEALKRYDKTVPVSDPARQRKAAEERVSKLRGDLRSLHEARVVSRSAIDVAELVYRSADDRLKLLELHAKLVPQNVKPAAAEDTQSTMYASLEAYQNSLGKAAATLGIPAGIEKEAVIKRSVRKYVNDYRSIAQILGEAEEEIETRLGDKMYARRSWKEAIQKQIAFTTKKVETAKSELAEAMETLNGVRDRVAKLEDYRRELENVLIENAKVEYSSLLKQLEVASNGKKAEETSEADVRKYSAERLMKIDIKPTESSPEFDAGDISLLKLSLLDNLPKIAGGITFGGTLLGMAIAGGGLEYGLSEGLANEGGRIYDKLSSFVSDPLTYMTTWGSRFFPDPVSYISSIDPRSLMDASAFLGSATTGVGVAVGVERGIERSAGLMVDTEVEKMPTALANAEMITGMSEDVKQKVGKRNLIGLLRRKGYGKALVSPDARTLEGHGRIRWTGDYKEDRVKLLPKPKTELELAATTTPLRRRKAYVTRDPMETTIGLDLLARYNRDIDVGDAVIVHYLQTNEKKGRAHDRPKIHKVVEGKALRVLDMERLVQLRVETGRDRRLTTKLGLGGFEKTKSPIVTAHGTESPADVA